MLGRPVLLTLAGRCRPGPPFPHSGRPGEPRVGAWPASEARFPHLSGGGIPTSSWAELRGSREASGERGLPWHTWGGQARPPIQCEQGSVRLPSGWLCGQWESGPAPYHLPRPPPRELGRTVPTGAGGEAPLVCTGCPGMQRDKPWAPLSQELWAAGQEGAGPASAGGTGQVGGGEHRGGEPRGPG